ncbi:hypothetical protein E2F46_08760 [Luteimonas aestuarii]|uniref:Uncharacterized protein n=1 Tax=Luteimonas aestuarii TaxID=453837 RepID=A0A4R5TTM1_9GAMM|nr:hypothetical protein [Luteimonas aestuarii]TDK24364.1 hypothetical protein E2F46_08760 [Luteimonas aestuarii]
MQQKPTDEDVMVAKQAAMEIVMLTMMRPLAGNPRFWADIEAIADAFQKASPDEIAAFPQRWEATRGFLQQWRQALGGAPGQV